MVSSKKKPFDETLIEQNLLKDTNVFRHPNKAPANQNIVLYVSAITTIPPNAAIRIKNHATFVVNFTEVKNAGIKIAIHPKRGNASVVENKKVAETTKGAKPKQT